MKRFIYRILLFALFPFLSLLSLDLFLRNQNSLYKEKFEGALEHKDSIEIIILGNSHANCGVDPHAFDLFTYNLANVAQSLYFDKRIAISLMPFLKKLKYVFISIDYHSLYFSSQANRDIWSYYGNGIKYKNTNYLMANLSPTLFGYTPKVSISLLKKKVINYLQYGRRIIDFDVEEGVNLKDTVAKGFITFEGSNKSQFTLENYKSRINNFNNLVTASSEKTEILSDLDHFLTVLLDNHITPIVFTSPTYQEYNKHLNKKKLLENAKDINNICKKHNLIYLDFMNSTMFEENDFYNYDHLNKKGAFKFGKMLNDSINKMEAQTYCKVHKP